MISLKDSILGFFPNHTPCLYKFVDGNFGPTHSIYEPDTNILFEYYFEADNIAYKYERIVYTFE